MNWKTILAMLSLIIIGFLGGFFTHRYLLKVRVNNISNKGIKEHFEKRFKRLVDINAEETVNLEPYYEKYAEKLHEASSAFHDHRMAIYDSLEIEISPLLSSEQQQQLKSNIQALKNRRLQRKKRPGSDKELRRRYKRKRE